jgi:hypothetical protein
MGCYDDWEVEIEMASDNWFYCGTNKTVYTGTSQAVSAMDIEVYNVTDDTWQYPQWFFARGHPRGIFAMDV